VSQFSGDWNRAMRILQGAPKVLPRVVNEVVLQEAHDLRKKMVAGIDGGGPSGAKFTAHSPLTLVVRRMRRGPGSRGSKIMVASATLRNSISVISLGGGNAFVGVLRTKRHPSGKSAVDIARIHEYGKTWSMPLTARMRRFLFAAIRKAGLPPRPRAKGAAGASSITIRIPPRPFIGPVIATHDPAAFKARMAQAIAAAVKAL
jgi:hypothetical protein